MRLHPFPFSVFSAKLGRWGGRSWGMAGRCEEGARKWLGGVRNITGLLVLRATAFPCSAPASWGCWPAISSHYSLAGSSTGINAAAFSLLFSATEEETLLSSDKHREQHPGQQSQPGPGARGSAGLWEAQCFQFQPHGWLLQAASPQNVACWD